MAQHTRENTVCSWVKQMVVGLALGVGLAGCTALTGESAGRNIDDASITAAVKTRLAKQQATSVTSVDVDTVNGTVYLTGTVNDAAAKQQATEIARNVDGVADVINNLQTRSRAADAPEQPYYRGSTH